MAVSANLIKLKDDLFEILSSIEGPSSFAYGSTVTSPLHPSLHVDSLGTIRLPLSDRDAQALASICRQSCFGRGTETVIDTNVRKSWELNPSQFRLKNPAWKAVIEEILDDTYTELALRCGRQNIKAELYKLLLYEEGAFFRPHQDSEKAPGMFGTLIVSLPSAHEGGDLHLSHNGETVQFKTSTDSDFDSTFAAWYADVTHEVKPITSGYRLVLTYNLIRTNNGTVEIPETLDSYVSEMVPVLTRWAQNLDSDNLQLPSYLLHKLEHQYTEASISVDSLKGKDLAQVQCLKKACAKAGFELYLASMEKKVLKDDQCYDYEEKVLVLNSIFRSDGSSLGGHMYFDSAKIIEDKESDDEPDEEEHQGYTGNEGAPATYWYYNMVVIIVPKSHRMDILFPCSKDSKDRLEWLATLKEQSQQKLTCRQDVIRLCDLMLKEIETTRSYHWYMSKGQENRAATLCSVVRTALEMDQLQLFDRAVASLGGDLPDEYYSLIGSTVKRLGVRRMIPHLNAAVFAEQNLAAQWNAICQIQRTAFENHSSHVNLPPDYIMWLKNTVHSLLRRTNKLQKGDGAALASIFADAELDHERRISSLLPQSSIAVRIAFFNQLAMIQAARGLDHVNFTSRMQPIVNQLQQSLRFEADTELRPAFPMSQPDYDDKKIKQLTITGHDLLEMARHLFQFKLASVDSFRDMVMQAVLSAPAQSFKYALIPFIELMIDQRAVPFHNDRAEPRRPTRDLVVGVLSQYVVMVVDIEPRAPKDWSRPSGGCRCSDCTLVNDFLQDGSQRVGNFPVGKARRAHLHQQFTDRSNGTYKVETIRDCNPNIWRLTKTNDKFKTAHASWETRRDEARQNLQRIDKDGRLKQYLGLAYKDIVSLDLIRARKWLNKEPLNNNGALLDVASNATGNVPPAQSRKRKLTEDRDAGARQNSSAFAAFEDNDDIHEIEVIDLTGE